MYHILDNLNNRYAICNEFTKNFKDFADALQKAHPELSFVIERREVVWSTKTLGELLKEDAA